MHTGPETAVSLEDPVCTMHVDVECKSGVLESAPI